MDCKSTELSPKNWYYCKKCRADRCYEDE